MLVSLKCCVSVNRPGLRLWQQLACPRRAMGPAW